MNKAATGLMLAKIYRSSCDRVALRAFNRVVFICCSVIFSFGVYQIVDRRNRVQRKICFDGIEGVVNRVRERHGLVITNASVLHAMLLQKHRFASASTRSSSIAVFVVIDIAKYITHAVLHGSYQQCNQTHESSQNEENETTAKTISLSDSLVLVIEHISGRLLSAKCNGCNGGVKIKIDL